MFIFTPDVHLISTALAWAIAVVYLLSIPNMWPPMLWEFRGHVVSS